MTWLKKTGKKISVESLSDHIMEAIRYVVGGTFTAVNSRLLKAPAHWQYYSSLWISLKDVIQEGDAFNIKVLGYGY